jgi:hypothetical protein
MTKSTAQSRSAADAVRRRDAFDPGAANTDMSDKLRRNALRRRARTRGLELRHSDSGYSLIDADRNRVDGRRDLTLDEVEKRLK